MTVALIVIDVQNDFCSGGALAVPEGETILPEVNHLIDQHQVVVLTQDWHPEGHSSFASSHIGRVPYELTEMPYGPQVLWPEHCVQGSAGAAFHADLKTDPADLILRKGMTPELDSYSAFFENDRQTPTGLEGWLKSRGIHKLRMVGLALDFCVTWSALDAAKLGFDVTVIQSATRAIDLDGSKSAALDAMKSAGVTLM